MKKTAYIVNHYNEVDRTTDKDDIIIYLSEEDYRENAFSVRFRYENVGKCEKPYLMLDNFFMQLKELQENGYELKFICQEGKE